MPAVSRGAPGAVVQPVGSQTRPSILARVALSAREMFFTSADLQKPDRLYQVIHAIQQNLATTLRILGGSSIFSGILQVGFSTTATVQFTVYHGLGRPYQNFLVTSAHGAAPSFQEILPGDVTYPPGLSRANALVLLPGTSGVFSFWIF